MADVHAYEDALKLFEDLVQAVADYRSGKTPGLVTIWSLLSDVKTVTQEVPDFKDEAVQATVQDWQTLGARAVANIVSLLKAVA